MPVFAPDIQKGFVEPPDDLSQLCLIDAAGVRALADEVNAIAPESLGGKKLVLIVATGGTLAMTTTDGVRLPAFTWQDVFRLTQGLVQDRFEIRGLNAFCIDSSQMDYRHTREIAITLTYLWNHIKVPFLGFLVTHGTDAMSFSGAALSLMAGQGLPFSVVYTGAQQPLDDPMSDAPINLRNALCTLEALHDRDMAEVLIVMGDRGMLATSAEKVDDSAANAFDAPRHCFATRYNRLSYPIPLAPWLNPRRKVPFKPTIWHGDYAHTLVIKSTLGLDPRLVARQVADEAVYAVILYSYGTGSVNKIVMRETLKAAQEKNIPVFIVNPVEADYETHYDSASCALKMGAIPLNMTLSAALAKIEIALRLYPDDLPALSRFMTESYVGEVPSRESAIATRRDS